jgi:opacity protein-like surface antigen
MAALAAFLATAAAADEFTRPGFYIGGGGSYVSADPFEDAVEDAIAGSGVSVRIDDAPGFNVRAGGRFLRVLAVELQYEWLDDYDVDIAYSGIDGNVNLEQQTLTANLKIYPIPVWRIQPYILAGVGFQHIDVKGSAVGGLVSASDEANVLAARGGVGLDLYLTEHIVLYGEAGVTFADYEIDLPNAVGDDIPFLLYIGGQAGLIWRF